MSPRILTALFIAALLTRSSTFAGEVALEDKSFSLAFDADSGALTRLENKATHWVIEQRPELGISFSLNTLSAADHKDNPVLGRKQRAVEVRKLSANQVRLQWKDLVSEHGDILPITLTAIASLTNGALRFDTTVENNSSLMVSTLDFPYLGDLNPPAKDAPLSSQHMWYGNLPSQDISRPAVVMSRQSLFCLIQSTNEGIYVEIHDATQPYLLNFIFDPRRGSKLAEDPARLEFHTRHFVYAQPHTTAKLVPVVLRGYKGDWHAAMDYYKEWRATWFKEPHLPDWAKQVHSWTMLRMNTPEQDYGVPYTNLVRYAREWAANGVKAVQVVGWNKGGQDGDDPSQDTEPGLGTWQEFRDAIAQVQAMGVKVILFAKLNWADLQTPWYTNELYKYECADQNGKRYEQGGYAYVTPTQLAGIGLHRRAVMDFLDPRYREIAGKEFEKILALGSEGWLWDELCHHATALYSWAPNHSYTPPGYVYAGDLPLSAQLRAAADKKSPDFIFSGEGQQDWLMQYFPVSETGVTATPVCQFLDRHALLLAGVSGFDDREQLNMILLRRCVIQYEPFLYKGYLSDFPLTVLYGKKIDALRTKYSEYLWDGEFRDTLGADVKANGPVRYSVFVAANGKRAVVVVNPGYGKPITAAVNLPHPGKLVVATPEQPDARPATGELEVPERSAAVLMER
jgi:hypothetical protein